LSPDKVFQPDLKSSNIILNFFCEVYW